MFCSIALCGLAADLLTKHWVFHWLGPPGSGHSNTWWLIPEYVGMQTTVNQGALFGMFRGFRVLLAGLSLVAAGGIFFWLFYCGAARDRMLTIALSAVTGGIFGNLFDRLGMWHNSTVHPDLRYGVRDWILFQWPGVGTWPNFNLADSLLVCGAGLLLWHAFRSPAPRPIAPAADGS